MTAPTVLLGVTIDDSLQFLVGYPARLVDEGWTVHVASIPGPRLELLSTAPGVTTHPIAMRREPSPLHDVRGLVAWYRLIRRIRPDAVSVGTPKAGFLGTCAAFLARVPSRTYLLRGLRLETSTGPRRALLALLERITMRCATDVVAISPSLRARAVELRLAPAHRIRVLGHGSSNGVDTAEYDSARFTAEELSALRARLGIDPSVATLGYVGRLAKDKGLAVLAGALGLLVDRGHDFQLLVVGGTDDGSGEEGIEQLRALGDRVVFAGHVPRPAAYYAIMDALCLPSLREGFGNVVIEASATSTAVVVSDATGIVDTVSEGLTGLVSRVGDPKSLADALEVIITDRPRAAALGAAGRVWVRERFDRSRVQDLYAADLRASLERHGWAG